MTKKMPGKGFEERGNSFGFPDFGENGVCMRRNGSGAYRREGMVLLLLEIVVCSFGGASTIGGQSPTKDVRFCGGHYLNVVDCLDSLRCKSSG
jgi:hypothetical protein